MAINSLFISITLLQKDLLTRINQNRWLLTNSLHLLHFQCVHLFVIDLLWKLAIKNAFNNNPYNKFKSLKKSLEEEKNE